MTRWIHAEIVLNDVVDIVRAAISIGAANRGGPLSTGENQHARRAMRRPALTRRGREELEAAILRGDDPLGEALMTIRSREDCRRMGSFYTPSSIVAPMVAWALLRAPEIVVDPGCGSGRFVAAVARRSPETELLAIDKDAVATLITRAVLAVLKPRRARVSHVDFLAMTGIRRASGVRVAWLGNPPYVRHHLLNRALKQRGLDLAEQAGHESIMTAGLHTLFFTKTKLLSESGDVGCYVSPSEWVDNRSGRVIRDLFLNGLGGQSLLLLDPETFAFAGVKTTAAITTFVISNMSDIRRVAMNVPVDALAAGIDTLGAVVPRPALMTSRGWSRVATNPMGTPDVGPTIGDLFRVHRGTATGANGFFVMTPDEAASRGIAEFGIPTIVRASEIIDAAGVLVRRLDHRLVVSFPKTLDRKSVAAVDAYLRIGERANEVGLTVSQGSNAQKRSPWWSFTVSKPTIVATYMARRPPAFAANPDRLGILNIAIAIEPKITMDAAAITDAVRALNDAAGGFEEYAVRYFGNLRKFEPRTFASLPLPAALHHLLHEPKGRS